MSLLCSISLWMVQSAFMRGQRRRLFTWFVCQTMHVQINMHKKKQKPTLYCDGVFVPLCFAWDVRDIDFSPLVRFYDNTSPQVHGLKIAISMYLLSLAYTSLLHFIARVILFFLTDVKEWIAKECSECMIPRLNISNYRTRFHPSKGENGRSSQEGACRS